MVKDELIPPKKKARDCQVAYSVTDPGVRARAEAGLDPALPRPLMLKMIELDEWFLSELAGLCGAYCEKWDELLLR